MGISTGRNVILNGHFGQRPALIENPACLLSKVVFWISVHLSKLNDCLKVVKPGGIGIVLVNRLDFFAGFLESAGKVYENCLYKWNYKILVTVGKRWLHVGIQHGTVW